MLKHNRVSYSQLKSEVGINVSMWQGLQDILSAEQCLKYDPLRVKRRQKRVVVEETYTFICICIESV